MSVVNEGTESTTLIWNEHTKIITTLESSDDKIFQTNDLLEKKNAYIEMVDKYIDEHDYSIAKKETALLNSAVNMVETQNTKLRDGAKKVYGSCTEAVQYAADIEIDYAICEDKCGNLGSKLSADATRYDEKMDELIKLLDQLTEKRYKKLEYLENQKKIFLEEKLDLEKHFDYTRQEEFLVSEDEDAELEALENELEELQSKLMILNDGHSGSEEQSCKNTGEELTQKCDESEFLELDKRYVEVNSEVTEVLRNMETQKRKESEGSNSGLTLGEYEEKLNKELEDMSKFCNDLTESPYQGFSNIEQEISSIKSDIIERNKKYAEVKNEDEERIEQIEELDKEIETTTSITAQLCSQSKEIENDLGNLKTSADFSKQYDISTKNIEDMCIEKARLADIYPKIKEEIKFATIELKQEKDKCELDLLAMENNVLMEIKKTENDYAVADHANTNLEEKAQRAEDTVKQLGEEKKRQKEELIQHEKQRKKIAVSIEQAQVTLKRFNMEEEKLNTKLGNVAAPQPIILKARDLQHFAKPKVCEVFKKRKVHKQSTPVAKGNWDSDSSWEAEQKARNDVLRKKYKKQSPQRYSTMQHQRMAGRSYLALERRRAAV